MQKRSAERHLRQLVTEITGEGDSAHREISNPGIQMQSLFALSDALSVGAN